MHGKIGLERYYKAIKNSRERTRILVNSWEELKTSTLLILLQKNVVETVSYKWQKFKPTLLGGGFDSVASPSPPLYLQKSTQNSGVPTRSLCPSAPKITYLYIIHKTIKEIYNDKMAEVLPSKCAVSLLFLNLSMCSSLLAFTPKFMF